MIQHKIVNGSLVELTDAEIEILTLEKAEWVSGEADRLASEIRNKRNLLLAETDYLALSDVTLTPEMANYRQALRDITAQEGFPYNVTFPTKPE